MSSTNGIVLGAAGAAQALRLDAAAAGAAAKALRGSLAGLGQDARRAARALARTGRALEGVTAALMQTATVSAGLDRGMANLYRWSKTGYRAFAGCLDQLAANALYLKNSLAAMAAPLTSAVAPALAAITERFAGAFNMVNQMIARLSGASTYVAARKTADAWDSVGGRITQAASALRRYVAGFDQLNVMTLGAGSSAGGASYADMFETRPIEDGVKDLADRLRGAFESGDWQALGTALAARLNAAVADIDWQALGRQVGGCLDGAIKAANAFLKATNFTAIGAKIGAFLSEAVGKIDFDALGQAIGRLLASALQTAAGVAAGFDWSAFGAKLAKGMNGFLSALNGALDGIDWAALAANLTGGLNRFIKGVDWTRAGQGLGRRVNDLIAVLRTGVETFDWSGAGTALANGLNGLFGTVDWKGLGRWLNRTLSGLLDFGISLVNGFDAEGFASGIGKALEQVDWPALAQKLWTLLTAALGKLGDAARTLLLGGTTDVSFSVGLLRDGWSTLAAWIGGYAGGEVAGKVGLIRAGWELVSGWVSGFMGKAGVKQPVGLSKVWSSVSAWVGERMGKTAVKQDVGLKKRAWSSVSAWVGGLMGKTGVSQPVSLSKTWQSVSAWVSGNRGRDDVDQVVGLKRNWDWQSVSEWVSARMGSVQTDQTVGLKQNAWKTVARWVGGYLGGGVDEKVGLAKDWSGTPQKALGLDALTATVTVGIAAAANSVKRFSETVASGISGAIDAVLQLFGVKKQAGGGVITPGGRALAFASGGVLSPGRRPGWWRGVRKYAAGTARAHGTLFAAGEAGPEIIGHINGRTEILNRSQLSQTMFWAVSSGMLNALDRVRFRMPAMATGSVLPYEVAAQVAQSGADIQNTLDANNEDLIRTIISVVGAQTSAIVAALSNVGGGAAGGLTARQVVDQINQRTNMFGVSPILS